MENGDFGNESVDHNPHIYTNPSPQQARRRIVEPFDNQLHNHIIFTSPRFSEISLSTLESEKAIQNELNYKFINI